MLRLQVPEPSPGVFAPISQNGRVNFGYGVSGPRLLGRPTLLGRRSQLLGGGATLLGHDGDDGCGCEREIGSIWGFLLLAGVGALGYAMGASSKP